MDALREIPKGVLGGWKAIAVLGVLVSLVAARPALATPICTDGTLASFQAIAGGCTIGNVLFDFSADVGSAYNPTGTLDPTVNANAASASDVYLTIVGDGLSGGTQVGFTFSTINGKSWNATYDGSSEFGDLNLNFTAELQSLPSTAQFASGTLSMTVDLADSNQNSFILAQESFNTYPDDNSSGTVAFVFFDTATGQYQSEPSFLDPQSQGVTATKDFFLIASDSGDSATIDSFTESFTYVETPEPRMFLPVALGILLFGAWRWRKRLAAPQVCVAVVALAASSAHATPACLSGKSVDYYQTTYGSNGCTVNDVLFTVSYTPGTGAPAATGITVTVIPTNLDPGLDFNPVITNTTTTPVSFTLVVVAQASTNSISDVGFTIVGSNSCNATSCGSVTGGVTSNYGEVNIPITDGNKLGVNAISASGSPQLTQPAGLSVETQLKLTTSVSVTGGTGGASTLAHISDLKLQVSQIPVTVMPEPNPFLLIGGSLVALAFGAQKIRKRSANKANPPSPAA